MIGLNEFIERLKDIYPDGYKDMSAGCMKLYLLCKELYTTQVEAWYNPVIGHILIQDLASFSDTFYDISGEVDVFYSYEDKAYYVIEKDSKNPLVKYELTRLTERELTQLRYRMQDSSNNSKFV